MDKPLKLLLNGLKFHPWKGHSPELQHCLTLLFSFRMEMLHEVIYTFTSWSSLLPFANQVNLWFDLGFEKVKENEVTEANSSACAVLPRVTLSGREGEGWGAGRATSCLWHHTGRAWTSPLGRRCSPSAKHRTPGTRRNMGPGLRSALNNNSVQSRLKPSHKSHLMLP